jgi:hypothetical protein
MQKNFPSVITLFPNDIDWEKWKRQRCDMPFSDEVIEFLHALSSIILQNKEAKRYPDIMTFAFYCRRANVLALKKEYSSEELRLGRGIVFHIAPSNVPVNFAYSMVVGLLSGNCNIVRVPTQKFPQIDIVISAITFLSEQYCSVTEKIVLVRYEKTHEATAFLSGFCDVRIIWGGDSTIAQIRENPIPARSFDVTFADRYSLAVINADILVNEFEMSNIAESFYNDTYLFDQNACTAPHLLVWIGDRKNIQVAQTKFWESVHNVVEKKYNLQPVIAVNKLAAFYRQAIRMPVKKETIKDNLIWRVALEELIENIDAFRCAGGYFTEYIASSLDEIAPIINNKYQTLAYYGVSKKELVNFVASNRLPGLDRLVPIGSTLNFSLTWDGYDLIRTLTRKITVH